MNIPPRIRHAAMHDGQTIPAATGSRGKVFSNRFAAAATIKKQHCKSGAVVR
jgi:hypothetical protein